MRGKTLLGEMQASLFFAEHQSTFNLVQENVQNASAQERATWAEYINRTVPSENRKGKTYTAEDVANNTDEIARQLAVYRYVPLMFNLDAGVADAAQENAIANVIASNQGAESGSVVETGEAVTETGENVTETGEPVTEMGETVIGAEQYSIERTKDMSWEDQLNNPRRNDTFVVEKNTPSYLTERGVSDRPLAIPQSVVVYKCRQEQ